MATATRKTTPRKTTAKKSAKPAPAEINLDSRPVPSKYLRPVGIAIPDTAAGVYVKREAATDTRVLDCPFYAAWYTGRRYSLTHRPTGGAIARFDSRRQLVAFHSLLMALPGVDHSCADQSDLAGQITAAVRAVHGRRVVDLVKASEYTTSEAARRAIIERGIKAAQPLGCSAYSVSFSYSHGFTIRAERTTNGPRSLFHSPTLQGAVRCLAILRALPIDHDHPGEALDLIERLYELLGDDCMEWADRQEWPAMAELCQAIRQHAADHPHRLADLVKSLPADRRAF